MKAKKSWTRWTQRRLEKLFQVYNARYFDGRLKDWGTSIGALESAIGRCDSAHKQLIIDADKQGDAQLRSTLLHEMAHAASRRMGHGYAFWEQIELLLQKGAPLIFECGEAPDLKFFNDAVPKRFPLARKAMGSFEAQRAAKVDRYAKRRRLKTQVVSHEHIITEFAKAAWELPPDCTENDAVAAIAKEYGLFDVGGQPKNAWTARIISEGRKLYRRTKRQERKEQQMEAEFAITD